jgi:hypothetical protein
MVDGDQQTGLTDVQAVDSSLPNQGANDGQNFRQRDGRRPEQAANGGPGIAVEQGGDDEVRRGRSRRRRGRRDQNAEGNSHERQSPASSPNADAPSDGDREPVAHEFDAPQRFPEPVSPVRVEEPKVAAAAWTDTTETRTPTQPAAALAESSVAEHAPFERPAPAIESVPIAPVASLAARAPVEPTAPVATIMPVAATHLPVAQQPAGDLKTLVEGVGLQWVETVAKAPSDAEPIVMSTPRVPRARKPKPVIVNEGLQQVETGPGQEP